MAECTVEFARNRENRDVLTKIARIPAVWHTFWFFNIAFFGEAGRASDINTAKRAKHRGNTDDKPPLSALCAASAAGSRQLMRMV
eukprot:2157427-Amphidinium_carterae.1